MRSRSRRRPGGRAHNSLRPLACELSCLHGSDGSSRFQQGETVALASVIGPVAPRLPHHEDPYRSLVSVLVKSPSVSAASAGGGGSSRTYELEWEQLIASVLSGAIVTERYPRTVLQVVVHILTADGSVLAAALHAAVSALLDAGIEMRYLPTAVTCCLTAAAAPPPPSDTPPISTIMEDERKNYPATTDNAAEILLDPSAEEEQERDTGTVVVVAHAEQKEVLALHTSNCCLSSNELLRCCAVAFRTGPAIVSFWRLALEQKTAREDRTLWSSDASA